MAWPRPDRVHTGRLRYRALPDNSTDPRWEYFRAAVLRRRTASNVQLTRHRAAGEVVWDSLVSAAIETFGVTVRPERAKEGRVVRPPKALSCLWGMDPKQTRLRWRELRKLTKSSGSLPTVVRMADGTLRLGQDAHAIICEWYSAAYAHPRTAFAVEWEQRRSLIDERVRHALRNVPKVSASDFAVPGRDARRQLERRLKRGKKYSEDLRAYDLLLEAPELEKDILYDRHWGPIAAGDPDAVIGDAQRMAELHRLWKGKGEQVLLSSFRGLSHQSHDYKMAERITQASGLAGLEKIMPGGAQYRFTIRGVG